MDAVELPLPAKVEFGKILAPAVAAEGVDGAGAAAAGGSGEVLRRCSAADRRHDGDVKTHNQNAEIYPSYRGKRTSFEVSMQKSISLGFKAENSVKRDYVGNDTVQSLHNSKTVAKKTIKLLDGPPCSKRPKLEPVQTVRDTETKRHDSMSQKNVPEILHRAPPEKSRLLKQKRVSDAKRIDKKNVRSGVRSKYDCFSSKAGLANFDSGFLGNSVLGAHGLKSDIRDITDHIENLSLSELLDGTYKYSSLGREKGKRVLHTKDELLGSVRKAFSMLSDMDNYGKEANLILSPKLPSASNTSCDVKEQCGDKPSSTKESSQVNVCEIALRHPKDILSCLTLSQGQDLDSLLSPGGESSDTVKPHTPSVTAHGASLPPFPWSISQSGGYRPSVDSGKHGSSRSNSHWQWVRVGSSRTPLDDEDSSVHKIGDLLQEMNAVKLSIMDSFEGRYNLCGTESTSGSLVQNIHSRKGGNAHGSQQQHYLENGDLSDGFQKHGNEDSLLRTPQASPRTLRAAEILCDMRRSNEQWIAQGYSNGAIKWPKSPSEKAMKACKPSSPFGTAESSSGSRNSDAARNGSNQSSKKIVDRKNDPARLNNPGKGSIRWPVPIEDGASPVRSERVDTRQPHGNGGRLPSQVPSQARLVKEYENQQKLRKATLTSSLGPAGDWNRERNRRT
ncbi:hypothetical protein PR202_gb06803 [Eleusine coracana subsp. coracana]|uniref:Uncharacterized protein n=1 Tax=Eleusine coracana subsp. coracana TaxID=191504 RepID=A0AAV5EAE2_ELECO|nr:hypothetical protein PR202_gb06803 [Eleusine coracana subsp. coracana]